MTDKRMILIVEDSRSLARTYQAQLASTGHEAVVVESGNDALSALRESTFDLALVDIGLPDVDGLQLLGELHESTSRLPVVVMTANGSINTAVEAIQKGASDFLVKPFSAGRLSTTIDNAIEKAQLRSKIELLNHVVPRKTFAGMVGESLAMQAVYRTIEAAASSRATVLVGGESGTGKELVAEGVHNMSPRKDRPFIALNCAALPKDLIESELFGHVKGAFTGATADREGAAMRANGGTLFLDEITELDFGLQAKLLRFLQTSSFQMVGSGKTETVDVRFVAATNRDPFQAVRDEKLREDLYYRLNVIPIELPSLRERDDDSALLADHFLKNFAADEGKGFENFEPAASKLLKEYDWPGNVRQLENAIRNIVVLNSGQVVTAAMVKAALSGQADRPEAASDASSMAQSRFEEDDLIRPLADVERETIERAIKICKGNIQMAARMLQINPSTIYRKRGAWGG